MGVTLPRKRKPVGQEDGNDREGGKCGRSLAKELQQEKICAKIEEKAKKEDSLQRVKRVPITQPCDPRE